MGFLGKKATNPSLPYSLLILNAAQVTQCFEISGSNSLQSLIQAHAATVQYVHMFGEQLMANS